ncbi:uncharacterized protein LTR77_010822 [Saxophila tyrrhenica]|uniref:Uncharacterized protein n=1 Tax=Saxophila tyrrhenica TaxID=1690608 RepID=A0AAV9NUP4_9PEZI|nr:hypothetical protein LTR77_010822 [Saxophila tyrrhenica]
MAPPESGSCFEGLQRFMQHCEQLQKDLTDRHQREEADDDAQHKQTIDDVVAYHNALYEKKVADRTKRHQQESADLLVQLQQAEHDRQNASVRGAATSAVLPRLPPQPRTLPTEMGARPNGLEGRPHSGAPSRNAQESEPRPGGQTLLDSNIVPDITCDTSDLPRLKRKLKARYRNLHEDDDEGQLFALCCHICGANTNQEAVKYQMAEYANMDKYKLRSHIAGAHKICGKGVEWVIEKCKGDPISNHDLVRIWRGEPTSIDHRVAVSIGNANVRPVGGAGAGQQGSSNTSFSTFSLAPQQNTCRPPVRTAAADAFSRTRSAHDISSERLPFRKEADLDFANRISDVLQAPGFATTSSSNSAASDANLQYPNKHSQAPTSTSIQAIFERLENDYGNLWQDSDGKMYAICCILCGCNASAKKDVVAPSFNYQNFWNHFTKAHFAESRFLNADSAVQQCKGPPISDEDIMRIYRKEPSGVDDRIALEKTTKKRGAHRDSGEGLGNPNSYAPWNFGTVQSGSRQATPRGLGGMAGLSARHASPEDDDVFDRPSKRLRTSLRAPGITNQEAADSATDDSINGIHEGVTVKLRETTVEDGDDEEWKPGQ